MRSRTSAEPNWTTQIDFLLIRTSNHWTLPVLFGGAIVYMGKTAALQAAEFGSIPNSSTK